MNCRVDLKSDPISLKVLAATGFDHSVLDKAGHDGLVDVQISGSIGITVRKSVGGEDGYWLSFTSPKGSNALVNVSKLMVSMSTDDSIINEIIIDTCKECAVIGTEEPANKEVLVQMNALVKALAEKIDKYLKDNGITEEQYSNDPEKYNRLIALT